MTQRIAGDPHGPNSLTKYLNVHAKKMALWLADGFVTKDGLEVVHGKDWVRIAGTIYCRGSIEIEVDKTLKRVSRKHQAPKFKTSYFNYNAKVKGLNNIFRYESAVGHRAHAHRHGFDTFGDGHETSLTEYHASADVPVLDAVIQDASEWHEAHREELRSFHRMKH